ncbi:hypothetical protein ERD78_05360 [Allopusillimonas soli]|uniref:DNA binding HTH domain-containing protein n=1 Tax=Allopusillimonas soli TaxID=659016 RepID=A0A853FCL9_9BURK|nr:hypothetical protein [Allopusillimonas soli]TEA76802.1 hypothetical protein ERD78_05360 [Allopusillimonas soli]
MYSLASNIDTTHPSAVSALLHYAVQLRRFDVCLLPVSEGNLAWARTVLSTAGSHLSTPVIAMAKDLKAGALNDLHRLGILDFVRMPLCKEELRVRVERGLDLRRAVARGQPMFQQYTPALGEQLPHAVHDAGDVLLGHSGCELEAFAAACASRYATSSESFRQAKSQVVTRFERAYIAAALRRSAGNITMAARCAQKHRRAFWALMRKHAIDAASYRKEAAANSGWRG